MNLVSTSPVGRTLSIALLTLLVGVGCPDVINVDQTGEGCSQDTDCGPNEICSSFGECRPFDDDEPDPGPTEPSTPTPDGNPSVEPSVGAPDPTPEPTAPIDAGEPSPSEPSPAEPSPVTPGPADDAGPAEPEDAGTLPEDAGGAVDAGFDGGVDAGEEDAGEKDAGTPTPDPQPAPEPEPEPECESDGDCANGLTCIDETCVVGCDGVPSAGTCTPTEFAYCSNPGQGNEQIQTLSLANPVCFNELLIETCGPDEQPQGVDCVLAGGDCSQGACIALPEGSPCDDDTLLCGNDTGGQQLLCADKNGQGVGTCQSGCGDIDGFGECSNDVVTYCADEGLATERLESYSCFDNETCGTLRPGIDGCVAGQGQGATCWSDYGNFGWCGSPSGNLACEIDVDTGQGVCVQNTSTCNATRRQCTQGNRLMTSCYQEQPILLWCGDHGGNCTNNVNADGAACTNVQFNEPCNNVDLYCANGLQCGAQGRCF